MNEEIKTKLVGEPTFEEVFIGDARLERTWNDGLCDCFNNIYPSLVCSFFTPVIYTGQQIERLTRKTCSCCCFSAAVLTSHAVSLALVPYSMLWSSVFGVCSGVTFLTGVSNVRSEIRRRNSIPGSSCEDAFLSVFCTPCSLAQSGREFYRYKRICDGMESCREG